MGILKSVGKGAWNVAKGAAIGSARIGDDILKGTGKGIFKYGERIVGGALSNPLKATAMIGGAAALGYGLADMDGRNDGGRVAAGAALGATLASGIPGVAGVAGAIGAGGVGLAAGVGGLAMGIGERAIKMPDTKVGLGNLGDMKFSKLGVGLMAGSALYEGTSKAVAKFEGIRMGTNDGMMRKSTPVLPQSNNQPSYANNGGATGDLVFSMYNNR